LTSIYAGGSSIKMGGGMQWSRLITAEYSKSAFHPFVGVALTSATFILIGDFLFAGSDRQNQVQGSKVRMLAPLNTRFRLYGAFTVTRFTETNQPNSWKTGAGFDYGMELFW
ncbi:MAG: hypothetical protein AB7O65_10130, partial [Candidatus Korobacteraceae bacterium]